MATISELFSIALSHHQTGRLEAAGQICRQILAVNPNHADALHLLGIVVSQAGRFAEAEGYLVRAASLAPDDAEIHNNLGLTYQRLKRLDEAETCCQKAISLRPAFSQAHFNLGLLAHEREHYGDAAMHYRQAIALSPRYAEAHSNLGNVLKAVGKADEAIGCYRQALAINSNSAESHNNLGTSLEALGRFDEAIQAFSRAIALNPRLAQPHHNLGLVLDQTGMFEAAIDCFRRAVALELTYLEAHINLGNALQRMDQHDAAVASFRRVLEIDPRHATALHNLAVTFLSQSRLPEAELEIRKLLKHHSTSAKSWALLAQWQQLRGQVDNAIESLQKAIRLEPSASLHSKLLFASQYANTVDPQRLLASHREWDATYADNLPSPNLPRGGKSDRIRIGFVSKDFERHPISFTVLPVLEALDRSACSVVCYSDNQTQDPYTTRFQATADSWCSVGHLSDEALAEKIRGDNIDVLVDLMGHTGNRMLVFARKPAPVQLTWFGYVGTTGLKAMDYLLADSFHVQPGEESNYAETVLRMPHAYACYEPPDDAPNVGFLPALNSNGVTFGCFNNPAKYSPKILQAWATILRRLPSARLLLKYAGLEDASLRIDLLQTLMSDGAKAEQVVLEGRSPPMELLATYQHVDIAIDTQPYAGGLTTCEALWMGVPVITFPGNTFAGRHAFSYLSNVGLKGFIAADQAGYVDLAIEWANRLGELASIRSSLRDRLRQSPLCNAKQFAMDFLNAIALAVSKHSIKVIQLADETD